MRHSGSLGNYLRHSAVRNTYLETPDTSLWSSSELHSVETVGAGEEEKLATFTCSGFDPVSAAMVSTTEELV